MDWNNYEFDNEPLPESGRWKKRIRLLLIFVVIAGVTAGLIYHFRPQESTAPQEPDSSQSEAFRSGEEELLPPASAEKPLPGVTGFELVDGRTGEREELSPSPAAGEAPPEEAPVETPLNPATPPPPEAVQPTIEPEKGKPWIHDPPQDAPAVVPNAVPVDQSAASATLRAALDAGKFAEAFTLAQQLIADPALTENSAPWREAAALLTRANLAAWENGAELKDYTLSYRARPGDSFSRVASRWKTTIEAVKRSNRVRPEENTLFLDQKLVIYPGPWRIRVEKAARLLKLYNCNPAHPEQLFAVFDVGIGRLGRTPTANFVISGRLKHPAWYTPNGGIIPYGDPENILGTHWLALEATGETPRVSGYGIHGTWDEASLGKQASAGCVRMRNAEVEELFTLVPRGTPVRIVE